MTADAKNCVYPNMKKITSADELKGAVKFDHVCGEFKKNYRNISNFVKFYQEIYARYQEDSTATTVAGLKDDLNALILKLRQGGLMEYAPSENEGE